MHKIIFTSALTLALAVSGAAFAQPTTAAPNASATDAVTQQKAQEHSAMTIGKLTQDLQKAGFTDVKVVSDAFLIQAKTKDGNPVVMTLGPDGVTALEMTNASGASQTGTTGQAPADSKSSAEPMKPTKH
jgi:hypothetical protein